MFTMNHIRRVVTTVVTSLVITAIIISATKENALAEVESHDQHENAKQISYKTTKIDGLDIFYREAGPRKAPAVLLLHGFPTSSHMFRELIPALADQYRVVAPDYPGFGNSSMPSPDEFEYTFNNLAKVVERFPNKSDWRSTRST